MFITDNRQELFKAISAAQGEFTTVEKNAKNPHFNSKFAPLDSIIEMIRPILPKHGLSVMQHCDIPESGSGIIIETVIAHDSGQYISSRLQMPVAKNDPQGYGSSISYGRRYALCAALDIVSDEDVDGNQTEQPQQKSPQGPRKVNDAQRAKLFAEMGDGIPKAEQKAWMEKLSAELKAHFKVESSNDLPAAKFDEVLKWVAKKKAERTALPEIGGGHA